MCETCQDCDSSHLTLPTGSTGDKGDKGDKGDTGDAGADGSLGTPGIPGGGGFITLHNDLANSTNTDVATNLFSPSKAYVAPIGTLSTNGSKFVATAIFQIQENAGIDTSYANAEIYIEGSAYTSVATWLSGYDFEGGSELKIELEISRVSTTDLFIHTTATVSSEITGLLARTWSFTESTTTVPDMSANTLTLDVRGGTNLGTLNCLQFTVDHLIL